MDVSLTPELEEFVHRQAASGLYVDTNDVISTALRLLVEHEEEARVRLTALREALAAGEASGRAPDFSMDKLMTELDRQAELDA